MSIACSWLFLYLDSVHQRRRAESLFADLKSLDFATAGFPEVRDIMIRNGDTPGPTCNPQNCTFLLQIMTRLPRIPLLDRTATFFYTTLPYLGVRSWIVYAQFEVRNANAIIRIAVGLFLIQWQAILTDKRQIARLHKLFDQSQGFWPEIMADGERV